MKKKIIASLLAFSLSTSVLSVNVYAVDTPLLYFKSQGSSDSITVDVANGDVTVNVAMYIDTDSTDIGTLSIKWQSDSEYITLGNLLDPNKTINEETEYTLSTGEMFSTAKTPCCFGKVSRGAMTIPGAFYFPDTETLNAETGRYATAYSLLYTSSTNYATTWLGGDSDLFMITDFEAVIDSDTPVGTYTISYITDLTVSEQGSISQEDANTKSYGTYFSKAMTHFAMDSKPLTINVINSDEQTVTTTTTTTTPPTTTSTTTTTTTTTPPTTTSTTTTTTTTTPPTTTSTTTTTTTTPPTTTSTTTTTTTTPPTTTSTTTTTTTTTVPTTTSTTTTEITTTTPAILLGDVNNDGVINASDASEVLYSYASFSSGKGYGLDENQLISADVNKDGEINSSDASRILEYYANISSNKEDNLE